MTAPYIGADVVETPNAVVKKLQPAVKTCRACAGGTLEVRNPTFLPQFPAERPDMYAARQQRSVFTNLYLRTIQGLIGMVFRRAPVLGEDVPEVIRGDEDGEGGQWENVDLQGTHGDVFLRRYTAQTALVQGLSGILVDYPPTDGKQTREDEQTGKVRPYFVPIEQRQVVSFRTEQVNGRVTLAQVVLCFERSKPKGEFVDEAVEEYRVYRRNGGNPTCAIWEKRLGEEAKLVTPAVPILNQTDIPIAWCYAGAVAGMLDCPPPLLDLAYLNLCHFNVQSDELTSMHYANVPVPVFTGVGEGEGEAKIGSSWAQYLPENGKFEYVESKGTALANTALKLEALKADMAVLGLDMLQPQVRGEETATGKRMDRSAQDSALAAFARSLQDCGEGALQFYANYLDGEEDGGSIQVNTDYEDLSLSPEEMNAYSALVEKKQISLETMWAMLEQGERLPDGFDPEVEQDKITAEVMAATPMREAIDPLSNPDTALEADTARMEAAAKFAKPKPEKMTA